MAYGKTLKEIKALRLAEESGLHKNPNPIIMADMPQLEQTEEKPKKRVAKKPKK